MKTLMIGKMASALLLSAALGYGISGSFAQTGSRLGVSSQPQTTIWMGPPGEIAEIRSLLQQGEKEKAITAARKFLAFVETDASHGSGYYQYYALNALCAALSTDGQLDEAASRCDRAIKMRPSRWEAINSRGTVHYAAGRYAAAVSDYRRALELEPDSGDVTILLRHNLELAEGRLSGS